MMAIGSFFQKTILLPEHIILVMLRYLENMLKDITIMSLRELIKFNQLQWMVEDTL